jgi:hypothetical protein
MLAALPKGEAGQLAASTIAARAPSAPSTGGARYAFPCSPLSGRPSRTGEPSRPQDQTAVLRRLAVSGGDGSTHAHLARNTRLACKTVRGLSAVLQTSRVATPASVRNTRLACKTVWGVSAVLQTSRVAASGFAHTCGWPAKAGVRRCAPWKHKKGFHTHLPQVVRNPFSRNNVYGRSRTSMEFRLIPGNQR